MDGEDREPDGGQAAEVSADETEPELPENPPLVPSRFIVVALSGLAVQFVLLVYVLSLDPNTSARIPTLTVFGIAFFAALMIGFDAYRTDQDDAIDWSPNPFVWSIPMFLPLLGIGLAVGIPFGVGLAYALRRYQTQRRGLEHIFNWPAVGAGVLSGAGFAVFLTAPGASGTLTPSLALVLVASSALYGFTTPATYFDTRHIKARLAANGENWLFRGYHWVLAMSVPLPLRSLVALGYALRRWMLLTDAPLFGSPDITADEKDDDKS